MKILLPLTLVCVVTVAAAAESVTAGLTRPGPPPLERLAKPLALTADQQTRLKPIFAQAIAQAASDVKSVERDELVAKQKERDADFRLKLAGVLSREQLSRYEALTTDTTPPEQAAEMFSAHGHRDADNAATATDTPDTSAERPKAPPSR
ncbi:MAG: hypothetical protein ABW136_11210 [Steroidobacteraceae bacterium]